ncbi:putative Polyadenylate-binding protein [Blattamonas nauphoetae]|uniref:Polyadenylate-binding protein n=1 Tax=Blattamonas nauphoetae TaxID=2049346 RepID=A0ABQ9XA92_9EUKA|nr:putative Polyadenylate-binding protein [Blattamonas nauphoetae]
MTNHSTEPQELDETNLYVRNIPSTYTDKDLHVLSAKYGSVVSAKIMVSRAGRSRGYGFVRYQTVTEAQYALSQLNGMKVEDGTLNVRFSFQQKKPEEQEPRPILYVKPISENISEDDLQRVFSQCGEVEEVKILIEPHSGKRRQIGFVTMKDVPSAQTAMKTLNNYKFDEFSPQLTVRYAENSVSKKERLNQRKENKLKHNPDHSQPRKAPEKPTPSQPHSTDTHPDPPIHSKQQSSFSSPQPLTLISLPADPPAHYAELSLVIPPTSPPLAPSSLSPHVPHHSSPQPPPTITFSAQPTDPAPLETFAQPLVPLSLPDPPQHPGIVLEDPSDPFHASPRLNSHSYTLTQPPVVAPTPSAVSVSQFASPLTLTPTLVPDASGSLPAFGTFSHFPSGPDTNRSSTKQNLIDTASPGSFGRAGSVHSTDLSFDSEDLEIFRPSLTHSISPVSVSSFSAHLSLDPPHPSPYSLSATATPLSVTLSPALSTFSDNVTSPPLLSASPLVIPSRTDTWMSEGLPRVGEISFPIDLQQFGDGNTVLHNDPQPTYLLPLDFFSQSGQSFGSSATGSSHC